MSTGDDDGFFPSPGARRQPLRKQSLSRYLYKVRARGSAATATPDFPPSRACKVPGLIAPLLVPTRARGSESPEPEVMDAHQDGRLDRSRAASSPCSD